MWCVRGVDAVFLMLVFFVEPIVSSMMVLRGNLQKRDECPHKGSLTETLHPVQHRRLEEPLMMQPPQAAPHLLAHGSSISQECTEL